MARVGGLITDRVIAHRPSLLTQWADEAGFVGQVQYLHEATSPAGSWSEASWSSPGSTIGLTRSAFYDSVMGPKSIFHHEIGHFLLNGGEEVASTQAAIRFLLQNPHIPGQTEISCDLNRYISLFK
jgi:hypothetical protein